MARKTGWEHWEGGYTELVEAARHLLIRGHDPSDAPAEDREAYERARQLNERLVRLYIQAGVVAGGARRGREVVFGYPQLLQLVTARHLVAVEGWKLDQVAAFMREHGTRTDDMRALLPARLADELGGAAEARSEAGLRTAEPGIDVYHSRPAAGSSGPRPTSMQFLVNRAEVRSAFRREVENLRGPSPPPAGERWIRFRLTPWTEVHVQEVALGAWTDDLVESLAAKLKDMLRAELARRGKRR